MNIETIFLEVLGDINDALKADVPQPEKIAMMRRAKLKAENQYSQYCSGRQSELQESPCSSLHSQ